MRPKSFFVNGGAGRVLCSIPAFEKYQEEHPDEDFLIICEGGTDFFKGHPTLYGKVYDHWHKNIFRDKLIHTDVKTPEPYRVWEYYNQKCNLSQAFDIEINGKGVRELPKPTIKLSKEEQVNGKFVVAEVRQKTNKKKTVVFQPFGRGVQTVGNIITDSSGRSFEFKNVISIMKRLQKKYSVILMSEFGFDFEKEGLRDTVSFPAGNQVPLRGWAGIIKEADLFLGCDSVGQHIAYSVGTPVVSVMGSTFGVNVSYPDHEKVDVLDMGEGLRLYDPIRVCPDEESARVNDGIMMMNDKVEEVIMKSVDKLMNRYYTKPEMEIVLPESYGGPQEGCPTCPPEAPLSAPKQQGLGPIELEAASNGVKIPSLEPSKKGFSQTVKVN
jgi:hypothetical protein|tara:strand:- start:1400 stop:2548 length:1149 start_codon:yes stop_codon:yes gene_type:complete